MSDDYELGIGAGGFPMNWTQDDYAAMDRRELKKAVARIAALEAELAAAKAGLVTVKPLVWHNFDAWTWWAEAVCGTYHVEERNGGWRVELRFRDARHIVTETDGFDQAIVAAQADYEARILPAISLSQPASMDADPAANAEDEMEYDHRVGDADNE